MQKISDSEIREALIEYQIMEAERLQKIAAESPHRFSLRFHLKMHSLLQKTANVKEGPSPVQRAIPIRKICIVLIAVLLAVLGLCATAIAVRNAYRLIENVFPRYSDVQYENPVSQEHGEFVLYEIAELPEGFVKDEESSYCVSSVGEALTTYWNCSDFIFLHQLYAEDMHRRINTEDIQLEPKEFNGIDGYYYSQNGVSNYLWIHDNFVFQLYGSIDDEILIDLIDNVKPQ